MKPFVKIGLIVLLVLAPLGIVVAYGVLTQSGEDGKKGDAKVVDWRTLRDLDYKTGEKGEKVAAIDGKKVRIPGFVVPLEDEDTGLSEFLLVPSPQACIHVPPPPPNQMVFVRMKEGTPPKRSWGPVWIEGTLYVMTTDSGYGKVSYTLTANFAERYKVEY